MEFFTYTLPNGIRCILKRVKSPVVHCAMTINTGSRDELASEHGMAHFVEHMLFKGTSRRRAWQVNCRLENLGGELNAYTTKEETVIHATTLKGDYGKAIDLIADIIFNSSFPEKEVEKEKQVIIDEINLYKDSPSDLIYDEFEDMLFAGSSLGHNILGSRQKLKKYRSKDISDFVARTYNTDQMVFSLIGNVSEKAFADGMDRYFRTIPENRRSFTRKLEGDPGIFSKSVGKSTHQLHCVLGGRAYGYENCKRLPLSLLMNTLGGPSANSLLNILLREKNALSYGMEASYTPLSDTGIATIYFTCERDKGDKCLELVNKQLAELRENPLSPRRLSMAKKQFLGQFAITAENNENYMLSAGKSYLIFESVESTAKVREKILSVTADDIMEVANDILSDMSVLIYK